jgi:hypothetical protein
MKFPPAQNLAHFPGYRKDMGRFPYQSLTWDKSHISCAPFPTGDALMLPTPAPFPQPGSYARLRAFPWRRVRVQQVNADGTLLVTAPPVPPRVLGLGIVPALPAIQRRVRPGQLARIAPHAGLPAGTRTPPPPAAEKRS